MDSELVFKVDGLGNIVNNLTGLGIPGYDTFGNYYFEPNTLISRDIVRLDYLYTQSWACAKVVEYKPYMMTKGWGKLIFEDNKTIPKPIRDKIKDLKFIYRIGQTFGNLYGDAFYIRYVNDGRDFREPINWDKVDSISYSRVYQPKEVFPHYKYYAGNYYDPEHYEFYSVTDARELQLAGVNERNLTSLLIHRDRILRFSGIYLPPDIFVANSYQHGSLLERFLDPYTQFTSSLRHTSRAMESFEVYVLAIDQLFEKIATGGAKTQAQIQQRLEVFQRTLSSMRAGVRDKNEDIDILGRRFNNVDNILEQLRTEMIAASGLTKPQFYQDHPSGLAATGQSERLAEANNILSEQETKWEKQINKDISLIMAENNINDDWEWEWVSTYHETPEEESKRKGDNAQSDSLYLDREVLQIDEVRSRFTGLEYSNDIHINDEAQELVTDSEGFTPEDKTILDVSQYITEIEVLEELE